MYQQGTPEFKHHAETYGPQKSFGYKDFISQFTAENFDADAWANLFRRAGAQFVVPVAEHHDGFAMYNCSFSDWPENGVVTIKSLASDSVLYQQQIEKVELLGHQEALQWKQESAGLVINVPAQKPCEHAFVFCITPTNHRKPH